MIEDHIIYYNEDRRSKLEVEENKNFSTQQIHKYINTLLPTCLIVEGINPKSCFCSVVRIGRDKWWCFFLPSIINILEDDEGFTYGPTTMEEYWNFLVYWVHFQKQGALIF